MPNIPQYGQQVGVRVGGLGAPNQLYGVAAMAEAITGVAEMARHVQEQDAAVWATRALSEAQTNWTKQFLERQEAAEDGATDFTKQLLDDFDVNSKEIVSAAPTRTAKQFVEERLASYRSSLANQALVFEAQERSAYTEDTAQLAIDAGRTEAYQNPDRFAELLAERATLIDNMRLMPERRRQLKEQAQYQIARDAVAGMVEGDASGALELMRKPAGASGVLSIEALSATDRANLMEAAERRRLSIATQAQVAGDRREKDVQDATSKIGDELYANGKLTATWIESNRERLSAEDFRYFYKALNGDDDEDAPRDVMAYADLRERASYGQDIRDDARAALTSGRIRVTDYDRLLGEVESDRSGWYGRGVDYISTSASVSDVNPDPAAAQRKASMLDDWSEWSQANPKATDDQAEGAYRRIVTEYALIDYEQMLLVKRRPRYLVGTRSEPNFDATIKATADAFTRGEISPQERDEQAEVIRDLEQAWQRAQTK